MAFLITGIAPHSFGEAFVQQSVHWRAPIKLICADLERNGWLEGQANYHPIELNLNPLEYPDGYTNFGENLRECLEGALSALGEKHISCIIQSAGIYWAGDLLDSSSGTRQRVYGVNLLGHIEVLHTVMQINAASGVNNREFLTHVDIGSSQGLRVKAQRSVYAPSKAAGIDFAAALHAGGELKRLVYFAAGPIDTYMLHHNHWVIRAKGPEELLKLLRNGDRDRYREILIDCSEERFRQLLVEEGMNEGDLVGRFSCYRSHRKDTEASELGILTAQQCAELLTEIVHNPESHPSGIYLAALNKERAPNARFVRFEDVDRYRSLSAFKLSD